ncbi:MULTISPECIES: hypothetical protein [Streptomycetaceae]|uniref:hypothetical protein n=1 Tax=Streptomycetaceae TaxID=2062 RepID=UPI00131A802E|nr:hypothetical protein [Streptomyces scabiei]
MELLLADAVEHERAEAGLHSVAAADFRNLASELVRCAVIADREAGATWEQIGRPHGLSADAARARYGRARLVWPPPLPG